MICTVAELHQMDLGTHMHVMEEWNEEAEFQWQPATVFLHGYYTRVIQDDGKGGLHIATYVTNGEGDLVSLRVYTDVPMRARTMSPTSSRGTIEELQKFHKIGQEMWWHENKGQFEDCRTTSGVGWPD